jgi:hypothetical protein
MADIVVITHAYEDFRTRDYLLHYFIPTWTRAGHRVTLAAGTENLPDADIAILHIDLSVIPSAYSEAAKRYSVVINQSVIDIRKKLVSRYLVTAKDDWAGPVMVKTDLNCGGWPEVRVVENAKRAGRTTQLSPTHITWLKGNYPIFNSMKEVPDDVWTNPGLVVERFMPERDERGFWVSAWVFFGERERCTRYLGSHPIIKRANILERHAVSVPEELRAERERLGFDYGKFDYVMHEGKALLLDANRTPGAPPVTPTVEASNLELANGIDALLNR